MFKKTRLLAGLTIGCVLSTPAAFAEEYKGFYVGAWGGSGSIDFFSKGEYDGIITGNLPTEVALLPGTVALTGIGTSSLDDSLSVWGAQIGYRFGKYVAVEAGYVNLGELSYQLPGLVSGTYIVTNDDGTTTTYTLNGAIERGTQLTSTGITGAVLGMFPINEKFDVHARAGLYLADTRLTDRIRFVSSDPVVNLAHRRTDASETELLAGVGATWNINESFSLRVEYQKFFDIGDDEKTGESDIDVVNLSVLFR